MKTSLFVLAGLVASGVVACSDSSSSGQPAPPFQGTLSEPGATTSNSATSASSASAASASSTNANGAGNGMNAGSEATPAPVGLDTNGATGTNAGSSSAASAPAAGNAAGGMAAGTNGMGTDGTQTPPAGMDGTMQPSATSTTGGPSAGCGMSQGVPTGAGMDNAIVSNAIVTFPNGYDGSTPVPIVFAFHGAGRTADQMRTVDSRTPGTQLEATYMMAYVDSSGTAWDLATDYPRFQAVRDQVLSQACVDTGHMFAMGHSSGAQFIAQMLGDQRARESKLAAIAPVSSSNYNNPAWSPVPTLLIHGTMDQMRLNDLNGSMDIMQYAQSNQCSTNTQKVDIGTCMSIANKAVVNPGCVQYQGCAVTTLFCNHNDPNYIDTNGVATNHGWPCFANDEIFRFFESVRQGS